MPEREQMATWLEHRREGIRQALLGVMFIFSSPIVFRIKNLLLGAPVLERMLLDDFALSYSHSIFDC